jgi:hypothetical protein
VVGEHDRDAAVPAIAQGQPPAEERVVDVHDVHLLEVKSHRPAVAESQVVARLGEGHACRAIDAGLIGLGTGHAEGEDRHLMAGRLQGAFVQADIVRHAADMGLVHVEHHANAHGGSERRAVVGMVASRGDDVKLGGGCWPLFLLAA